MSVLCILLVMINIAQAAKSPCIKCVTGYDTCLSDLFQGLGSMDGDDIKNCQIARDECLAKIGK